MAAYAADLRVPRDLSSDRWTRDIRLYVPVVDSRKWQLAADNISRLLTFLTGDKWELVFRAKQPASPDALAPSQTHDTNTVCLFSGGLDSLVGAVDLLSSGTKTVLVGQHGAGMANTVQRRVLEPLREVFGSAMKEIMFYIQPPKNQTEGENTMRSRSILFLALGVAAASALGDKSRLIVAENGLISLNVPLTIARMGSLSTRTTHPHTIALFKQLLTALDISVLIELPYRFQTKGEMLRNTKNIDLMDRVAPLTMSCSHPEIGRYSKTTPGAHCGYCVPCIIRRAALNAANMPHGDYDLDILSNPPTVASDRGHDLRAFQMSIERLRGASRRDFVVSVISTGSLPISDTGAYANTYERGMNEVSSLLGLGIIP